MIGAGLIDEGEQYLNQSKEIRGLEWDSNELTIADARNESQKHIEWSTEFLKAVPGYVVTTYGLARRHAFMGHAQEARSYVERIEQLDQLAQGSLVGIGHVDGGRDG